jgi:hypothetical protein
MAAWAALISVRWRKVPAGPVKLPTAMRSSWRRSSGQVASQVFSAMRASRRASQHRMTWARILVHPEAQAAGDGELGQEGAVRGQRAGWVQRGADPD